MKSIRTYLEELYMADLFFPPTNSASGLTSSSASGLSSSSALSSSTSGPLQEWNRAPSPEGVAQTLFALKLERDELASTLEKDVKSKPPRKKTTPVDPTIDTLAQETFGAGRKSTKAKGKSTFNQSTAGVDKKQNDEILPLGKSTSFKIHHDSWDSPNSDGEDEYPCKGISFRPDNAKSLILEVSLNGYTDGSLRLSVAPSFSYNSQNTKNFDKFKNYFVKYGIPEELIDHSSISVSEPEMIKRLFKILSTPNTFPKDAISKIKKDIERGSWKDVQTVPSSQSFDIAAS